jgi:hypothetical protein
MKERESQLEEWKAELEAQLREDLTSFVEIENRIQLNQERLRHIAGLLEVSSPKEGRGDLIASLNQQAINDEPNTALTRPNVDLLDACEQIMSEPPQPVHVKDLCEALRNDGVALPGKGNEANIISRLHKSKGRFVRTSPGTYGPAGVMQYQDYTLKINDKKGRKLTDAQLVQDWHTEYPDALHLDKQNKDGVFTYVRDIRRNYNQGTQGHGERNEKGELIGYPKDLSLPYDEAGEKYYYSDRWLISCKRARADARK